MPVTNLNPMSKEDQRIVDTFVKAHNTAMFAVRGSHQLTGIAQAALLTVIELMPIWNVIPKDFQNGPDVTGKQRAYAALEDAVACLRDVANREYPFSSINQAVNELWAGAMNYADEAIQEANPDTDKEVVRAANMAQTLNRLDKNF